MPWNCSYLSVSRFFSPTEQLKVGRQEQKHPLNSPFHGEEEPPQRIVDLTVGLCPEKLGRRDAGYLFEEAGEVGEKSVVLHLYFEVGSPEEFR